jgi:hypothetical protein
MPDDEPTRIIKSRMDAALSGSYVVRGRADVSFWTHASQTSLSRRTADGRWQIFHHQGTPAVR